MWVYKNLLRDFIKIVLYTGNLDTYWIIMNISIFVENPITNYLPRNDHL